MLRHVQECEAYQRNKGDLTHPARLLHPLLIPEGKWESILMYFITRLPMVQRHEYIYVVVDRLTKYAHFFPIPTRYSTSQVAKLFFKEVLWLHGLPRTIFIDRDIRFMGYFWQDLFRLVGTKLTPIANYHPWMDGHIKIANKWLEGYLQNYVTGHQRTWMRWLHLGEYCYSTTYQICL